MAPPAYGSGHGVASTSTSATTPTLAVPSSPSGASRKRYSFYSSPDYDPESSHSWNSLQADDSSASLLPKEAPGFLEWTDAGIIT